MVDMAALLLGATPFSVYTSSPPAQLRYLAQHSEASIAIVESPELLERLLQIRDDLPALRHVVIVDDPEHMAPADVVDFSRLVDRTPIDWETAARAAEPQYHATVVYTSGTTGPPKGGLITHRNVCWTVESALRRGRARPRREALRLVPADGAHCGADGQPLLAQRAGHRGDDLRGPGADRSGLAMSTHSSSSPCPGCGRRPARRSRRSAPPTRPRADAFRVAVDVGRRVVRPASLETRSMPRRTRHGSAPRPRSSPGCGS